MRVILVSLSHSHLNETEVNIWEDRELERSLLLISLCWFSSPGLDFAVRLGVKVCSPLIQRLQSGSLLACAMPLLVLLCSSGRLGVAGSSVSCLDAHRETSTGLSESESAQALFYLRPPSYYFTACNRLTSGLGPSSSGDLALAWVLLARDLR